MPASLHLLIVANGFRVVGLVLGIPALLLCLWLTADLARSKPDPSTQSGSDVDLQRDGIVGVVGVVAKVIFTPLGLIGQALEFVARIIDILAAMLAVAGACLFFTGRGLVLHAAWARILAGLMASGFLLVSLMAMTVLKRGAAFGLIPIGMAIYMLWTLIRRF